MDVFYFFFIFKFTTADNTFCHTSILALVYTAEIITRLVFAHRPRMFSMIWLQADINRYLLHWFPTAFWFFFLISYYGLLLAGLTLIIIDSHSLTSCITWVFRI